MPIKSGLGGNSLLNSIKYILIIGIFFIPNLIFSQGFEDGLYFARKGWIVPKYALLEIKKDSAKIEIIIKWQGTWFSAINPKNRVLIKLNENSFSDDNTIIKKENGKIKGKISNSISFSGKVYILKFKKVNQIPKTYINKKRRLKDLDSKT